MPTILQCGSCSTRLRVPEGATAVKCPKCSTILRLPGAAAPPAAPKPAAPKPAATAPAPKAPAPAPAAKKPTPAPVPATSKKPAAAAPAVKKPAAVPPRDEAGADEVQEARKGRSAVVPLKPGQDPFKRLDVPDPMQTGIRELLAKGEEIVWVGRSVVAILLKKARIARILGIILFFAAVGVIVAGTRLTETIPLGASLGFGGVLLLFSILFMFVPYLIRRTAHGRPCYLLTNQRVIVYQGGWIPTKSYNRRQLMTRMDRRDSRWMEGAGDLIFEVEITLMGNDKRGQAGSGSSGPTEEKTEHGFMDIANVRDVENLIRQTLILRKPTQNEETADANAAPAEKPASPTGPKKESPVSEDDNIKPMRRGASWLTEEENAELSEDAAGSAHASAEDSRSLVEESELPASLKASVLSNLYDDESVVWVGRPHQKIVLLRSLLPTIFVVGMGGLMAYTCFFTGNFKAAWWMVLAFAIVVAIGALTPFYYRRKAHSTGYVLTTRRALVFEPNLIGHISLTAYLPDVLAKMRRRNSWVLKEGGDLIFRTVTVITTTHYKQRRTGASRGSSTSVSQTHYGFMAIADVARAERLINETLVEPYLNRVHGV